MPWQPIQSDDTALLRTFNEILTEHPEYAGASVQGLRNILGRDQAELWLWSSGSGRNQHKIALATYVTERNELKIVNCIPSGNYKPDREMKTTIRKVREIADRCGCELMEAEILQDYQDTELQSFLEEVPELMWELNALTDSNRGRNLKMGFRRSPDRKSEDARMQGPKIPRPQKREEA